PVEPIRAILKSDNWDDEYFFKFLSIKAPATSSLCAIYSDLFSPRFTSTHAEKAFLKLWFLAMHLQMDRTADKREVFLEESDFAQTSSRLFHFLFPIPQIWVSVYPKPTQQDYSAFQRFEDAPSDPQRVDFLI